MTGPAILVDARLPWGSGIGRYVRNIVPPVAARMPTVNFTLLVAPGDAEQAGGMAATCANVGLLTTTIRPFSIAEQTALPALADGYDLTWFTNYCVPLRWRGRFVATVHDLMHIDTRFPAPAVKRFAAARTFAKVRRDAEHILFVSRFTARVFEESVGMPRASSVVHHGLDHASGMTGYPTGEARGKTALVVAAAKEHKNFALLLDAWQRADLPDWQLAIVTPADGLRSSIDLADRAGRIANVRVLRGISDAELGTLYSGAGFVMVPSRYEGFGLPLLEAMLAGAPVVVSTAEALVEVASGASAQFVSPADRHGWVQAIRRMAAECGPSNEWQAAASMRNLAVARTFTWNRAAQRTADVITGVLEPGADRRQ